MRFPAFLIAIFVTLGVALDQWTKYLATHALSQYSGKVILKNYLEFILVHNPGAAYGMLEHQQTLLWGVSIAVLFGIYSYQSILFQTTWRYIATVFLLIGTVGNLIDRLRLEYVIDFINIYYIPVFNIADICINISAALYIIDYFLTRHDTPHDKKP